MEVFDKISYAAAIKVLNDATAKYDIGQPIMTDKEWDDIYFKVVEFENNSGIHFSDSPTQSISYEVVSALRKVEHNHKMLSLDKTKDFDTFLKYFGKKDAIEMLKLDGLTCSLRYIDGNLVSAETRGNGIVGEDILHNAKVIPSIPKTIYYKNELVVDGEIICTQEDFEEFSNEYANPRNFASGSIRLLDSKECSKRNLTFVVWNVVKGFDDIDSLLDKFEMIEDCGFKVVPRVIMDTHDAKSYLVQKSKDLGYPIDGLVGRFDSVSYCESLGETQHHSKAAYAFKFYDDEYETQLIDIEWTMGRTGVLTPVAVFEPIDTGDSIIERASLHNLTIMKEQLYIPYKGERIWVYKANQIIPQISKHKWVANDYDPMINMCQTPSVCPICGKPTEVVKSDSGTENLVCSNSSCEGKLINRLDHFCGKKGLDIKGLSKATLEKLIDWNWVSCIKDLYHLDEHVMEWVRKSGFGEKSVKNIISAIEDSRTCELHSFISAIGIPLIGSTYAKQIAREDEDWQEFRDDTWQTDFSIMLAGFGPQMNSAIHDFNYAEADDLANNELTIVNSLFGKVMNTENINFCTTGKLHSFKSRAELKSFIESQGWKLVDSISSKTNYLITNDQSSTTKYKKALELNIPILTEDQFIEQFKKNT